MTRWPVKPETRGSRPLRHPNFMWLAYGETWRPPQVVNKPERKPLPLDIVKWLVEAEEKIHARFDADPKLKELYYSGYVQLLDTIIVSKPK